MRIYRLLPASALIGLLAGCAMPPAHSAGSGSSLTQGTLPPQPVSIDAGMVGDTAPPEASIQVGVPASSTPVGARAGELGRQVDQLDTSAGLCGVTGADIKAQRTQISTEYFTRVAQINARLEAGTTAGNPELAASWKQARGSLDSLDREAMRLGDLVTSCTDDTAEALYLTQSIHAAMSLRGAVEADRAELIKQSGRVASISSSLELTLDILLEDLNRQNEMLMVEHRNLTTLAHAIDVGQVLGNNLALKSSSLPSWTAPTQGAEPVPLHHHSTEPSSKSHAGLAPAQSDAATVASTAPGPATPAAATPADPASQPKIHTQHHHLVQGHAPQQAQAWFHHHRPLIVVPLDGDAGYEHALYSAVNTVLSKRPDARFVVEGSVQHNPNRSLAVLDASLAQRQTDAVARSLAAFGLPETRVTTMNTVTGTGRGIFVYAQ
jgi:hypothetical protein